MASDSLPFVKSLENVEKILSLLAGKFSEIQRLALTFLFSQFCTNKLCTWGLIALLNDHLVYTIPSDPPRALQDQFMGGGYRSLLNTPTLRMDRGFNEKDLEYI